MATGVIHTDPRSALEHYRSSTHPDLVKQVQDVASKLTIEEQAELLTFQMLHLTRMVLDALSALGFGAINGLAGPGPDDKVN